LKEESSKKRQRVEKRKSPIPKDLKEWKRLKEESSKKRQRIERNRLYILSRNGDKK
jgi:hypothetical protein